MAIVQLRNPGPGRDYCDRRKADGKSSVEAMRALKRRLSDIVFGLMLDDAVGHPFNTQGTGPEGQQGNDSETSATGSQPRTSSSDQALPDPSNAQARTPLPAASRHRASHA
jgi:transposase